MEFARLRAYLLLNAIEHRAGVMSMPFFEEGFDVEEVVAFPREKWEMYFSRRKCDLVFQTIRDFRTEEEIQYVLDRKIGLLPFEDDDYPPLLREIYNPPRLLFYLGRLPRPDTLHVAVVGARDASTSGKYVAEELGVFLAKQGLSVVSGFARGIDRSVHRGVLQAHGYAVGVIGMGIQEFLKPRLFEFYAKILENGAVFSEFPVKYPAFKANFPLRNRIITGMSLATIIVEARLKSGTMISAKHALEQGRELFAIPGPIHAELSAGPNFLIRSGATLISDFADIMHDLKLPVKEEQKPELSPEEQEIVLTIEETGALTMDDISYRMQKPIQWLAGKIAALEQKGVVSLVDGDTVRLKKS
jgi:DNA processing protein